MRWKISEEGLGWLSPPFFSSPRRFPRIRNWTDCSHQREWPGALLQAAGKIYMGWDSKV